jgi:hypothetical protein
MKEAFAGTYVMRVDIVRWDEQLLPALGISSTRQLKLPQFRVLDDQGRPLGPKIGGDAWGEDIPENMAPPLKVFFRQNLR